MKKRDKNNKREIVLEKEVSISNGKYRLELLPEPNSDFPRSFNLSIQHLNPRFLEKLLGEDRELWLDACHDYRANCKDYGHMEFKNTTPHEIGYNPENKHFYVHFHQDVMSELKGETPNLPRTKHFPIPTIKTLKELFDFK